MAAQVARPITTDVGSRHDQKRQHLSSLQINGSRLMDSIHSTCDWGKAHAWGEYVSDQFTCLLVLFRPRPHK